MAAESEEAKTWVGNMLCFFLLFSASMAIIDQGRDGSSNYQNLEIQKLSKKLNRPAVKSIKMTPCFHPEKSLLQKSEVSAKSQPVAQLWQQSGSCPEETIPIRRIRKEDILRAKSIQQFGKKNLKNIPQYGSFETHSKHQFAAVYVKGDKYHGGMATMNVWNPHVQEHNEFSDCQISILNDNIGKGYNSIQAGWQVNPRLYGDNNTRFFTFWRGGSGENASRCYDLFCSGFIQVNHRVVVGAAIRPLSAYGDSKSQHAITILVWKLSSYSRGSVSCQQQELIDILILWLNQSVSSWEVPLLALQGLHSIIEEVKDLLDFGEFRCCNQQELYLTDEIG
ncbi:uncharacterized protein LOC114758392 [Neltuma alba]|uniref:uncharacterized protein LOC114758392 n=1 Tax=Neltuma alba TaxID=207710 RepID=UPI0010A43F62|nr:uncharacterized protein LOC114758392 [Prosopis alba]